MIEPARDLGERGPSIADQPPRTCSRCLSRTSTLDVESGVPLSFRREASYDARRTPSITEALLVQAENRVHRRIWVRKNLPLELLFLIPGLLSIGTRSRVVLLLSIAIAPLLFVLQALLARWLPVLIGPEGILVRRQYERLRDRESGS
jgi:hypothetical protein